MPEINWTGRGAVKRQVKFRVKNVGIKITDGHRHRLDSHTLCKQ